MRFLIGVMRGLHLVIGIHTPPPEKERLYVFVWIGIIIVMAIFVGGMFYVLS